MPIRIEDMNGREIISVKPEEKEMKV